MIISVLIPSLFEVDGEYLKLCVESLRESTKDSPHDWHIIVSTNGMKYKPNLDHIKGWTNHVYTREQGQCRATNVAAQIVNPATEYIMVSNADMYYAPEWDKNLRFEDPVFSPNLVEPVNNAGSAPPFLKEDGGLTIGEFDKAKIDAFVRDVTYNSPVRKENGFNLPFFIKKDLWDFLGGYDVAYDPWGSNSDTDFQTRINLAGVTPVRLRDILVWHFSNKTPTFAPENDAWRLHNFEYFKDKFGFDRDELGSDVWYNKDMIPGDESLIKYKQRKYV